MSSIFWGLNMKPNRKYSQTIIKSFHISGIALDQGETAKLYVTADKQKYIVGTVSKAVPQVQLDMNFSKGDKIVFQAIGDASVSLLGYLHDIDESEDELIDEEEYDKLAKVLGKKGSVAEGEEGEDDEDDDDDDVDKSELLNSLNESLEEDSLDGEEEFESEEDSDEAVEEPKPKQAKLDAVGKKPGKGQNGVAKNEKPKPKENKAEPKKEQPKAKNAKQGGGERVITGGVKIEDVHVGNGPEAKPGKRVGVFYIGRFKSNNKTFDSTKSGDPFKFRLGKGEVIKGWDIGVAGMKVGGKRRITCPPHMAYGARGSPPTIPPNSTLVFDVELKNVN